MKTINKVYPETLNALLVIFNPCMLNHGLFCMKG